MPAVMMAATVATAQSAAAVGESADFPQERGASVAESSSCKKKRTHEAHVQLKNDAQAVIDMEEDSLAEAADVSFAMVGVAFVAEAEADANRAESPRTCATAAETSTVRVATCEAQAESVVLAAAGSDAVGNDPAAETGSAAKCAGKKNNAQRRKAQAAAEAAGEALRTEISATRLACRRVLMHKHRQSMPALPLLETLEARMTAQVKEIARAELAREEAMTAAAAAHAAVSAAGADSLATAKATSARRDTMLELARLGEASCERELQTTLKAIVAAVAKEDRGTDP
jgi:hypothetical protein